MKSYTIKGFSKNLVHHTVILGNINKTDLTRQSRGVEGRCVAASHGVKPDSRELAVRRAGRWVKSCPKAEQIVEKEILITDSTLEKTFFFHLSHTQTAVEKTEASTDHVARKRWFCTNIFINC